MVREDSVMMSMKKLKRLHVIRQVMEQRITQVEAGTQVGLTDRHVRHLLQRVEQEGNQGLTHRGHGTPSNRRLPETVQATALTGRRSGREHVGRRWRSATGSRSGMSPCGGGGTCAGSLIAHGERPRTGRGGKTPHVLVDARGLGPCG